jgi:predicted aspartyl protease
MTGAAAIGWRKQGLSVITAGHLGRALLGASLLAFFSVFAAAQSTWPQECKLHRVASFPITRQGMIFTVPVMINGVEKKFMVDTGGYGSSVNEDVAKAMGIRLKKIIGVEHIDAAGKIAEHWVTVDSFRLGNFEGKDFNFVATGGSGGDSFDGVLAPDLLRNFDIEFDFANQAMNLFRPHACAHQAVYWTSAYLSLPLRITDAGHVRITVNLDGKDVDAIMDTGASSSMMAQGDAARIFDIKPEDDSAANAETLVGGNGGTLVSRTHDFKTLSLGEIALNHPKIRLYDGSNILRSEGTPLVLGMSELRFLHLYLAYKERELYISVGEKH